MYKKVNLDSMNFFFQPLADENIKTSKVKIKKKKSPSFKLLSPANLTTPRTPNSTHKFSFKNQIENSTTKRKLNLDSKRTKKIETPAKLDNAQTPVMTKSPAKLTNSPVMTKTPAKLSPKLANLIKVKSAQAPHRFSPPQNSSTKRKLESTECKSVKRIKIDSVAGGELVLEPIKLENGLFKCPACEYTNHRRDHCRTHIIIHDDSKKMKCSECNYTAIKSNVLRHQKNHDSTKTKFLNYCSECSFGADRLENISAHESSIHQEIKRKQTKLKTPSVISKQQQQIVRNEKFNSPTKRDDQQFSKSKCLICDELMTSTHVNRHYRSHPIKKVGFGYKCKICNNEYLDPINLYHHYQIHNQFINEQQIKENCQICGLEVINYYQHLKNAHKIDPNSFKFKEILVLNEFLAGKLKFKECKSALNALIKSTEFKELGIDNDNGDKIVYLLIDESNLNKLKKSEDVINQIRLIKSMVFYVGSGDVNRIHSHKNSHSTLVQEKIDQLIKNQKRIGILIPLKELKKNENLVLEHCLISAIGLNNSQLVNQVLPNLPNDFKYNPYDLQLAGIYLLHLAVTHLNKQMDSFKKVVGYSQFSIKGNTTSQAQLAQNILSTSFKLKN